MTAVLQLVSLWGLLGCKQLGLQPYVELPLPYLVGRTGRYVLGVEGLISMPLGRIGIASYVSAINI